MNSDQIRKLQAERDKMGREAHEKNTDDSCDAFREVRNKIKSTINKSKRSFITNALSSRRPKEVWELFIVFSIPTTSLFKQTRIDWTNSLLKLMKEHWAPNQMKYQA